MDNKDYVVWTRKDNASLDKTERKIISFIHSDKKNKKKLMNLLSCIIHSKEQ